MLIKKIAKILRGNLSFLQIMFACILGAVLGFTPGFDRAPGLSVFIILLFIVLNANLGIFLFVFSISKLVLYLTTPAVFYFGGVLLDNIATGLFTKIINAPVLAFFGFEYYLTSGGALVGLIVGILMGMIIFYLSKIYRASMSMADSNVTWFAKFKNSFVGKALVWILFGKGSDGEIKKSVLPVRISGIVLVGIIVGGVLVFQQYFAGNLAKKYIKMGLEKANGATVDIQKVSASITGGKLVIDGLAIANSDELNKNIFAADKVIADLNTMELMKKRLRVKNVSVLGGNFSGKRAVAGSLLVFAKSEKEKEQTQEPPAQVNPQSGEDIGKYVDNANEWKERLKSIKKWYERLPKSADKGEKVKDEKGESLRDRLKREALALGYQNVKASHLIIDAPKFAITKLKADNVKVQDILSGETLTIQLNEISDKPYLVNNPPMLSVKSSKDTFELEMALHEMAAKGGASKLTFALNKLEADNVFKSIKLKTNNPLKGGYVSVKGAGSIFTESDVNIDMALDITLEDSTLTVPKLGEQKIEKLIFPIYLTGSLDNPRVKVDTKSITEQLKGGLKDQLKEKVKDKINEEKKKLEDKYKNKLEDKVKSGIGGFLNN
ncbi:hypothetical protein DSN97_05065 [Deferribacteraceae bacterium V6Fe1]|nr:hypothetical protein DSN97_05065 [Deferribacteraceae bacterium V6Fe1]